jgi:hypothetical protein
VSWYEGSQFDHIQEIIEIILERIVEIEGRVVHINVRDRKEFLFLEDKKGRMDSNFDVARKASFLLIFLG